MILLDTNVVSELMLAKPETHVLRWLDRQPASSIWISAVTVYEIRFGLLVMPPGNKRSSLIEWFERWLVDVVERRIVDFDNLAAGEAAKLAADRKRVGRLRDHRDTMIAGIVLANQATLATRNVRHFDDIAKSVVNPWE
jgi:hypothetical protein